MQNLAEHVFGKTKTFSGTKILEYHLSDKKM